MSKRMAVACSLAITLFFTLITASIAQGIIVPPEMIEPWHPDPWGYQDPITLQSESIQIDLDDQFAHVQITQVFRNNTDIDLEGTYLFPLPVDADISDFALWLDGRELNSETLRSDEARNIYQSIVSSMRDPGLLEYMGSGLIQASVYPIPARGTKQVDLNYDWLLPIESGLIRMDLPLKLDGYSIDVIEQLAITVRIESPDTLGSIYSPTHDIDVNHDGSRRATVGFEKGSHRPEGDFVLYISRPDGAVGMNMLNYSTHDDEGFFLAMLAPEYDESNIEIVPKDFVCVLDTSGSMSGNKIEQAKDALNFIFQNLNEEDRFRLITFSTDVYPYNDEWWDASSRNLTDIRDHIDGLYAGGSTHIEGALDEACKSNPGQGRPMYIIFLTDGLPTVGNTNTAWLIDNFNSMNESVGARLFCFGVGDDVDYPFIDRLARENGGYTSSVSPYEDLEQPLSDFYAKIKSPVMTDIEIEIDGTRVYDMLPETLPDLFLGSQIILTGRYNGEGNVNVRLSGYVGDEYETYTWNENFDYDRDNDFIPRHWATRRVGYLLNQIRLYGENQEVIDEIVEHALRYGIITPYTSMLVTENEYAPMAPLQEQLTDQLRSLGYANRGGTSGADMSSAWGAAPTAQAESLALQDMEEGERDDTAAGVQQFIQYQRDKTFIQNADLYWIDTEYSDDDYDPIRITYLSDEYFDLVADYPELAEYLAVGEQVIVVYQDIAYQIDPEE